jgi:uncharacterized protein
MNNIIVVLDNSISYVKEKFTGDSSGHDWTHTERVYNMAMKLAEGENVNLPIIQLAALLHDVEDWKLKNDQTKHNETVNNWMVSQNVDNESIEEICSIIEKLSFKGAGVSTQMDTIEGKIVQDADRLDAIGAIGIARAFAYGGYKNRTIYNADIKPVMHTDFNHYKQSQSTTINHFYEKLLLLKGLMNTEKAKQIAEERHKYMEAFLDEFYAEWKGES